MTVLCRISPKPASRLFAFARLAWPLCLLMVAQGAFAAAARSTAGDSLKARCDVALRQALKAGPWSADDSVDFSWELPTLVSLPQDAEILVEALQWRPRGVNMMNLQVLEQGRRLRRLSVPVRVRSWDLLPVARRDLIRGTVLEAQDLEERWVESTRLAEGDQPALDRVLGRRLTRFLLAGHPVPERILETQPDLKRGERLTVTVRSGGVAISAAAEALEEGSIGESIQVRMTDTGRRLMARLTAKGQAEVEAGG